MVLNLNSGGGNRCFSSQERLNWLWDNPSLRFHKCQGSFPGLEQPRSEVDSLLSFWAEVEIEWSSTSSPPIFPHGVHKYKYISTGLSNKVHIICVIQINPTLYTDITRNYWVDRYLKSLLNGVLFIPSVATERHRSFDILRPCIVTHSYNKTNEMH
jgi:hypothetical protein